MQKTKKCKPIKLWAIKVLPKKGNAYIDEFSVTDDRSHLKNEIAFRSTISDDIDKIIRVEVREI
jgi:hypothetical protein